MCFGQYKLKWCDLAYFVRKLCKWKISSIIYTSDEELIGNNNKTCWRQSIAQQHKDTLQSSTTNFLSTGNVAALVRSHLNSLKPFERTIQQTILAITPSSKTTVTPAAMMTNRITSLRELLHYRNRLLTYTLVDLYQLDRT